MGRYTGLRRTALATALGGLLAALLAGCAGYVLGRPTPVPGNGPHGMPQPTATEIATGANPNPRGPQMNPFVAELRPPGAPAAGNPYAWLHNVRSSKTRHWILVESRATRKALAALAQRAWILRRLEQLEGGGMRAASPAIVTTRILYLSPDGVRLPMDVVHRRGLALDGNEPTLLSVYHSTGKPVAPLLQPFVRVWLEMGGVYARAEVRNGLAKVAAPQGMGRVPDRSIALGDLFSAAQSLIDEHYTRRARLGIYGRGFGGLLAGAAVTRRPEFFGAALPTGTWMEYRRITSGDCFPPTLVVTAEHDGDFRPWRGYELAAALQAEQLCGHPILLRVESEEGAEEPVAQRRERMADELAFAGQWLGARPPGNAP
jgi:prolyl oligopeptidase PreP (S9A serine peptidase family)